MEVVITYEGKPYYFDVHERTTGLDVRKEFHKRCNIGNGEYRLVCIKTDTIINDEDVISEHESMQDVEFAKTDSSKASKSEESSSSKSEESEKDEAKVKSDSSGNEGGKEKQQEAERPTEEQSENQTAAAIELKTIEVKLEEALAEDADKKVDPAQADKKIDAELVKKFEQRKVDLLINLYSRCEHEKQVDFDFIRNEIMHVIRLEKVPGTMAVPANGERIPRIKRMSLVVQEGFPIYIQSKLDGHFVVPCLGHDTLKYLRQRFAKLAKVEEPSHLILRKGEDNEILNHDSEELTLDDLHIEPKTVLVATRVGEQLLKIMFNFGISLEMKVDYGQTFKHNAAQLTLRHAPDLFNVHFDFWYRGHALNMDHYGERILGEELLGFHFLRVMIAYDPELGYDVDPSPQVRMYRCPRKLPDMKNAEKFAEEFKKMDGGKNEAYQRAVDVSKQMHHLGTTTPVVQFVRNPDDHIIRLMVNKRAKRYLNILVERDLAEHMVEDSEKRSIEHKPPFILQNITMCMSVVELKQKLEKETEEPPEHQSITINHKLLTPDDDHMSLRSLGLGNISSIYMEPLITIKVLFGNHELELKFPARSTRFEKVIEVIEREHHIPSEQCYLEYKGVAAIPNLSLSDYKVSNNDQIKCIKPFKLDMWHDTILFQQYVWLHTSPREIYEKVSAEANIDLDDLIICTTDLKRTLPKTKPTLNKCNIKKDMEFDIFHKAEYSAKMLQKAKFEKTSPSTSRQGTIRPANQTTFGPGYVADSRADDSENDDDPNYVDEQGSPPVEIDDESDDDPNYHDE